MTDTATTRRRLPADPDVLCCVRDLVADRARQAGFDDSEADRLANAVNEAVCNVIRHGYEGKPGGTFELAITVLADDFVVEIADEGRQIDPARLRPCPNKDPRCPGGLGLAWMHEIMDNVTFAKRCGGGMLTRMVRHRPGEP
jgi:anti-sigma regulatory factor (Ser/Thr protein kinase)